MNVLEKHAEKSDKIFSSSNTIICFSVGSQMPTSVSYLSSKQTNLPKYMRRCCKCAFLQQHFCCETALLLYWNIYIIINWFLFIVSLYASCICISQSRVFEFCQFHLIENKVAFYLSLLIFVYTMVWCSFLHPENCLCVYSNFVTANFA